MTESNLELRALLSDIESANFAATVGVVSTLHAFENAIAKEQRVRQLLGTAGDRTSLRNVYGRLLALAESPADPEYTHPSDLPIAVYLRVVEIVDGLLGMEAARLLAVRDDLWWSRRLARRLLAGENSAGISAGTLVTNLRAPSVATDSPPSGLTAERTFRLVDAKPARTTVETAGRGEAVFSAFGSGNFLAYQTGTSA